ncbi:MAG: mandelate racemase/muconate lactonizing enzyme family protein [Candidatus Bathyarchaeota archaeon]|nr:MAG: mandelate racemase/muconate lactonizing enzyme family protein [Candidatus Bathyarchaeota archaeon]
MKITDVEMSRPISVSLRLEAGDAINRDMNVRTSAAVKVSTDEGISGVCRCSGSEWCRTLIDTVLKSVVVGEDPLNFQRIWDNMYWATFNFGRKGASIHAMSFVDIAIWDIIGKATKQPLYKLLGGYRDKIPVYGSSIDLSYKLDDLVKIHETFVEEGYKAVKMKVGKKDHNEDLERVKAVRDAIGDDIDLMVDANNSWGVQTAIRMGKKLERYDLYWLEEPVRAEDMDGLAKVAASIEIPLATGESEYTKYGFKELIERKAVDIVQADVSRVGGITEWMKIAAFAEAWNLPMAPHARPDIHAHLAAAIPNGLIVEVFTTEFDPLQFDYWTDPWHKPKDGYIELADTAGIGLEVNEETINKCQEVGETPSRRRTYPPSRTR